MPVIAEEEVAAGRIPAHDEHLFPRRSARRDQGVRARRRRLHGQYRPDRERRADARRRVCAGDRAGSRRLRRAAAPGSTRARAGGRSATRPAASRLTAVASKSHLNQATIDYLEQAVGDVRLCRRRLVAQILHRRGGQGRHLSARVADQRMGHGRRPCGAARRRRAGRWAGRDAARYGKRAFLNRAFVATSRLETAAACTVPRAICRRRGSPAGALGSSAAVARSHGWIRSIPDHISARPMERLRRSDSTSSLAASIRE